MPSRQQTADRPPVGAPDAYRLTRWETLAGWGAVAGALAYSLPHVWWGMGYMAGYPGSEDTIPDVAWQRAVGFWGMGFLSALAGLLTTAMFKNWGRRIPRPLMVLAAAGGGTGLALWGLGFVYLKFFIATGRVEPSAQVAEATSNWNYYWYPVFFVWGISLVVSAVYLQRRPRRPITA